MYLHHFRTFLPLAETEKRTGLIKTSLKKTMVKVKVGNVLSRLKRVDTLHGTI